MKVIIEYKPYKKMRYATVGDWYDKHGKQRIDVAITKSPITDFAISIHEQIERFFCELHSVSQKAVDDFDMNYVGFYSDDPGLDKKAPYHKQHLFATDIEREIVLKAGLSWEEHNKYLDEVCK